MPLQATDERLTAARALPVRAWKATFAPPRRVYHGSSQDSSPLLPFPCRLPNQALAIAYRASACGPRCSPLPSLPGRLVLDGTTT